MIAAARKLAGHLVVVVGLVKTVAVAVRGG